MVLVDLYKMRILKISKEFAQTPQKLNKLFSQSLNCFG